MNQRKLLFLCVALALQWPLAALAAGGNVLFVLDGSGSMWAKISGRPKIEVARAVMDTLLQSLPADVRVGLETYGRNRKDDCQDVEILAPVGSDHAMLIKAVNDLDPKGSTPLAGAIALAATQFREVEGSTSVVVVSDGKETCGGDPCAAVREAIAQGVKMQVHVVGFDVAQDEAEQLRCIAKAGNGKYFAAANAEELGTALTQVSKEVVPTKEVAPAKPPTAILFEDHFDRDELGEAWEVVNPDQNRLTVSNGTLLTVTAQRPKGSMTPLNLALMQKPLSGDFVATVKVNVPGMEGVSAGLYYWIDQQNFILVGPWVRGEDGHAIYYGNSAARVWRRPSFTKVLNGQADTLTMNGAQLANRPLKDASPEPEVWYLQLQRQGVKYTGRVSTDGVKWTDIGSHIIVQKNGRLGMGASQVWESGHEHPAEFSDFVVKGAE